MTATVANVRLITGVTGDPPSEASIQLFIATALLLTEDCEFSSEAKQDSCNEYLAAHLMASSAVGQDALLIKSEKIEDVYSVTFQTAAKTAMTDDFTSTPYAVTANMLSNGCLVESSKRPIAMQSIGCN